ncbi:hypothetical protein AB0O20_26680 [Streptomyces kronopolitis]
MNGMLGLVTRAGLRRRPAVGISTVLVGSLLPVLPAAAQPAAGAGATQRGDVGKAVPGSSGARAKPRKLPSGPRTPAERPKREWPEAATATIRLTGPDASPPSATAGGKGKRRLPLNLAPAASRARKSTKSAGARLGAPDTTVPTAVTARVLSQRHSSRAGIDGVLFTLQPVGSPAAAARQHPGPLRVGVDYGDFAWAYGGGHASRLHLVELPACAATSPDKAECRVATPLATRNDTEKRTLTSAARGNGGNDNEYWELTAPSGTRFYFGYHKLPGWASGKDTTNSAWTVPVFGNNSGEDCHKVAFKDSWCQQGRRWNLDYVVDPHGNALAYYYDKETNSYGRDLNKDDDTPYTRGGSLKRIEYGRSSGDLYAGKPLAQVSFTNAERCLPQSGVTCAADTVDAKSFYWYDTPWDLSCKAGTACDQGRFSPTFGRASG